MSRPIHYAFTSGRAQFLHDDGRRFTAVRGAYVCSELSDSEAAAILAAVRCMAREHVATASARDDADPYAEAEPFADLPDSSEGHL